MEPYGPLTREVCEATYAEQARALAEGGVDLLVLETLYALEEMSWALEGIRQVTDLPLVVSFSFDQGTRTMMGVRPTEVAAAVAAFEVSAVGANCGRSLEETAVVIEEFVQAAPEIPLWVKPNAGTPQRVDGAIVYEADPAIFAEHLLGYVDGAPGSSGVVAGQRRSTSRRSPLRLPIRVSRSAFAGAR